jgi:tripartite-type tricarboxylate transporter receptor subunit TctC
MNEVAANSEQRAMIMITRRDLIRASVASTLATGVAGRTAMADGAKEVWPNRFVRMVVPFTPGGGIDAIGRLVGARLSEMWGQQVVLENKPGAGGNIAAADAAHAAADGYTLFMATTGTHATNINLYKNIGFDPVKDFAPLTLVTLNPQVIVPAPQYGSLDLAGLVARLQNNGGASFGSSGIGSATHIAGELYNKVTGSSLVHVPYRGQGPALNDLIAGRIDAMFPLIADTFAFLQSGQLKAGVVMSTARAKSLPNVPTTAELGYPKLVLSPIWTALYTRAGTPQPVVDRLNRELVKIIAAPAFVSRFEAAGYEIKTSTPAELASFAAAETARWGQIIRDLNIQVE